MDWRLVQNELKTKYLKRHGLTLSPKWIKNQILKNAMDWRLLQNELKSKYLKDAMDWRSVQNKLKYKLLEK
jgi:hypothetical protein